MATGVVGSLLVKFSAVTAEFDAAIARTQQKTKTFASGIASSFRSSMGEVSGIARDLATQFGGSGLGGIVGALMTPEGMGLATISAVVYGFKSIAENAKSIVNESNKLHVGVEYFQKLQIASQKTGVDIGTLEGGIARLRKAIGQGSGGPKSGAFADLGLDPEALGKMNTETALQTVASAIRGVGDEYQRAAIEQELFGKSGWQIEGMLGKLATGMDEYRDRINSAGDVMAISELKEKLWVHSANLGVSVFGKLSKAYLNVYEDIANGDVGKTLFDFFGGGLFSDPMSTKLKKIQDAAGKSGDTSLDEMKGAAYTGFMTAGSREAYSTVLGYKSGDSLQSDTKRTADNTERLVSLLGGSKMESVAGVPA